MSCPKARIGCVMTSNPQVFNIFDSTRCNYMRLADYAFYTNDTVINSANNVINVNGTNYTLIVGNYNAVAGSFASYLSGVVAGMSVTYDQNFTGKFSFTFSGAYTLTIPSLALRRILGFNNTTYTGAAGTLVADNPAHFTNSDWYGLTIAEAAAYITYTPTNNYSYIITNDVQPGSVLRHECGEVLPIVNNKGNTIQQLTLSLYDQNGTLVPMNGSNAYFYIDIYDLSQNGSLLAQ